MADKASVGGELKRNRKGEPKVNENSPVIQAFRVCQHELDTKHDKYERLVKISRDITIESKRTIFLLHRVAGSEDPSAIIAQAREKIAQIQSIKFLAAATELDGEEPYQFVRAYSPGLQEYIEAVTFLHYLAEEKLITLEQIQKDLRFPRPPPQEEGVSKSEGANTAETEGSTSCVHSAIHDRGDNLLTVMVSPMDYMLGIADLTGELMRLAIMSVGAGDLELPFKVCEFVRTIQRGFVSFGNASRELTRKMSTLRQSLQKVETACYTLQVRGSEIPKHMLVDVLSSSNDMAPYVEEAGSIEN